jgi:predicted ArsR family transcriptional regulator
LSESLLPQFAGKNTDERLTLLLSVMDGLGFQAKLTQTPEKQEAVIEASNCIYHDLAQHYEEVCEFDKTLISTLSASKIEQTSCMAKGDHVCAFSIKNPS